MVCRGYNTPDGDEEKANDERKRRTKTVKLPDCPRVRYRKPSKALNFETFLGSVTVAGLG